jgi:glycolate oxidase FAD binding subunit
LSGGAAGGPAPPPQAAETALPGDGARILSGEAADRLWRDSTQEVFEERSVGVKLGFAPADLPRILVLLHEITEGSGLTPRLSAHAGSGVAFVGLPGDHGETQERVIVELRERLGAGASLVLLEAPPELKRKVGVWGDITSGMPLMRRVKQQFDPEGVMSPGRFVGGI